MRRLTGWSKGDLRSNGKSKYDCSRISFEPIKNEAYGLDEKLELLLNELEKDIEGVRELGENSNAIIFICRHQYISGNAGIGFGMETINRLNKLNLGIDIDTYVIGNEMSARHIACFWQLAFSFWPPSYVRRRVRGKPKANG